MGRLTALVLFLMSVVALHSKDRCSQCDYRIDDTGNLVFCTVLENLPLSQSDIYMVSCDYLRNAYRDTRYKIVEDLAEKGRVIGAGVFESFFQSNSLTKGVIFNAPFHLRIDAKDGRARIQLIARNYNQVVLNDFGGKEKVEVPISTAQPFSEQNNQKIYRNAFESLHEKAHKTILAVKDALDSAVTTAISVDNDENW